MPHAQHRPASQLGTSLGHLRSWRLSTQIFTNVGHKQPKQSQRVPKVCIYSLETSTKMHKPVEIAFPPKAACSVALETERSPRVGKTPDGKVILRVERSGGNL